MQGPIAQALVLVCVGNAFLRGRDVAQFWPDAAVFRFSKTCDFRDVAGDRDTLIAADPMAWLNTLRAKACKGLRLHHATRPRGPNQTLPVSDRMLAGFVGGGRAWRIEEVGSAPPVFWQGFDRLGDREDPRQKIWLHTYLREVGTAGSELAPTLAEASERLLNALHDIAALATRMKLKNWVAIFSDAASMLQAPSPPDGAFADDFRRYAGFNDAQIKMLAAASEASVFGGMGSWNDVGAGEADAADYERLSQLLFETVNDAICALANSTYA